MTISFLTVHPVLAVEDLAVSAAYYRDKLGFTIAWQWGSPPFRAGVARDTLELQLHCDPDVQSPTPGQVYFHVTGVEDYYRECTERGASVTSDLESRPWGMKDFRVVDPSGNRLGFGESVGPR